MSLDLVQYSVAIHQKPIIHQIDCTFFLGKNYCLLGPNGSGKSSLALAMMGHPEYIVGENSILTIDGEDITAASPDHRSQLGLFLAFQTIPELPGVKLFEFLRTLYNAHHHVTETFVSFKKIILPLLSELHISPDFLWRDTNVWFSGGEKRKIEVLQLKLLQPKYIILDEIDSGLDIDAFRQVAELLQSLSTDHNTFIIITHYFQITDYLPIDEVMILDQGRIVRRGDASLIQHIQSHWFVSLHEDSAT